MTERDAARYGSSTFSRTWGLKDQGLCGIAPPGQNPEWKQGLLLQTWVQTSDNCSIVYKVRDTAFNYHSPQSLKKISVDFQFLRVSSNILALYAKLLSL